MGIVSYVVHQFILQSLKRCNTPTLQHMPQVWPKSRCSLKIPCLTSCQPDLRHCWPCMLRFALFVQPLYTFLLSSESQGFPNLCPGKREKKIKFPSTCSKIPLLQLFLGPCPLLPTELHCGIPDQISTVSGIQIKGCKLSHWHPHKVYQDVNIKFSGFNSCTWVRITSCISTAWEKQILSNDM